MCPLVSRAIAFEAFVLYPLLSTERDDCMARAAMRHYRVAQKEVEQRTGLFIPEEEETKVLLIAVAAVLFVFIEGLIIGCLWGKGSNR